MKKRLSLAAFAVVLACGTANAQQINVKIGVLTDMSSLYADVTGPGSLLAAKMAATDFMKENPSAELQIQAHTDEIGSAQYNLQLSQKRASGTISRGVVGKRFRLEAADQTRILYRRPTRSLKSPDEEG